MRVALLAQAGEDFASLRTEPRQRTDLRVGCSERKSSVEVGQRVEEKKRSVEVSREWERRDGKREKRG